MIRLCITRPAVFVVALCAVLAPACAFADSKNGQVNLAQATKRTLLVFPFDVPQTMPDPRETSGLLTDIARGRLIASDAYTVIHFHKSLPPVARLHNDQQLSDADVNEPFAQDNVKATKVTKAVGYDAFFVGSVDGYEYNEAKKQATVTISGRLLDVLTGKIIKSATLGASSGEGGSAKEGERAMEAVRNAGDKLMIQLVPVISFVKEIPGKDRPVRSGETKKKKRADWIWGVLAVGLGIGIGLASGSGGGGGGADVPPSPPR